jgi:acyl-CoA reductase-like NAD-dependent aldehyde dehydrogenase
MLWKEVGIMEHLKMYIGGKWVDSSSTFEVRLPYDNSPVATVPSATREHVEQAIEAAAEGFKVFSGFPSHKRAQILEKVSQILEVQKEELARIVTSETGKPIKESRFEIGRAVQTMKCSAEEAKRIHGEVISPDAVPGGENRIACTMRFPIGVIAAITPFNVPLNLACHKIGPAIAAGNSVILKPASATPLSAIKLAQAFEEAGIPEGAVNVITGQGGVIGEELIKSEKIAMITFTGSVDVGRRIREAAGLKKVTLELGSNSAVIVEDDANISEAVTRCVQGGYANSGQVCISVQRIYVSRKIFSKFMEMFVSGVGKLKVGHPMQEDTDISSLIAEKEAQRVMSWIEEAVGDGATIVTGGKRRGSTILPTVITDARPRMKVCSMELFGPAVVIGSYDDTEEAIDLVNDSRYGLQAGVYTQNLNKAFHIAKKLNVGGVMINEVPTFRLDHMPYGGTKESGIGREGPRYAIEEMTESKLVCFKL